MEELFNNLKKTTNVLSFDRYVRVCEILGIKDVKDLENIDCIKLKLKDKSDNTKKYYYAALTKISNGLQVKKDYKALMDEQIEIIDKKPTKKYEIMTREQLEKCREELIDGITDFNTRLNYDILLDYVVLSLYLLQKPRRNQYFNMKIASKMDDIKDGGNYLVWGKKKKLFVFQTLRTSTDYEVEKISDDMEKVLKKYLSVRGLIALKDNNHFLVKYGNLNFENSNDITRRLHRAIGKRIGSSLIKRILK